VSVFRKGKRKSTTGDRASELSQDGSQIMLFDRKRRERKGEYHIHANALHLVRGKDREKRAAGLRVDLPPLPWGRKGWGASKDRLLESENVSTMLQRERIQSSRTKNKEEEARDVAV